MLSFLDIKSKYNINHILVIYKPWSKASALNLRQPQATSQTEVLVNVEYLSCQIFSLLPQACISIFKPNIKFSLILLSLSPHMNYQEILVTLPPTPSKIHSDQFFHLHYRVQSKSPLVFAGWLWTPLSSLFTVNPSPRRVSTLPCKETAHTNSS